MKAAKTLSPEELFKTRLGRFYVWVGFGSGSGLMTNLGCALDWPSEVRQELGMFSGMPQWPGE